MSYAIISKNYGASPDGLLCTRRSLRAAVAALIRHECQVKAMGVKPDAIITHKSGKALSSVEMAEAIGFEAEAFRR